MVKTLIFIFFGFVLCIGRTLEAAPPLTPLLSRDAPAYTNDDCGGSHPASLANNSDYGDSWQSCAEPSVQNPSWIAYDLSGIPLEKRTKVVVIWTNDSTGPYDHKVSGPYYKNEDKGYNNLRSYTLQANAAPGGTLPASGWAALPGAAVTQNTLHSRQHVLNLSGYNWLRLSATASDGTEDNMGIAVNLDVYDAGRGLADDWIFYGDSIVQGSMDHNPKTCELGSGSFSQLINARKPQFFPIEENGGIGGLLSADGAANISKWLPIFPGKYVVISYGANDAWNCVEPEVYYRNCETMIKAVLAAGKVPVLPSSICWSASQPNIQKCGTAINQQIQNLFAAYPRIIRGPDFWTVFKKTPSLLSKDGVHPSSPKGMFMFRKMWADAMIAAVYSTPIK